MVRFTSHLFRFGIFASVCLDGKNDRSLAKKEAGCAIIAGSKYRLI